MTGFFTVYNVYRNKFLTADAAIADFGEHCEDPFYAQRCNTYEDAFKIIVDRSEVVCYVRIMDGGRP